MCGKPSKTVFYVFAGVVRRREGRGLAWGTEEAELGFLPFLPARIPLVCIALTPTPCQALCSVSGLVLEQG